MWLKKFLTTVSVVALAEAGLFRTRNARQMLEKWSNDFDMNVEFQLRKLGINYERSGKGPFTYSIENIVIEVSSKFYRSFNEVLSKFQRSFNEVLSKFYRVLSKFHRSFNEVLSMLQRSFIEASTKFYRSFIEVASKLHWRFIEILLVMKNLLWKFTFHNFFSWNLKFI